MNGQACAVKYNVISPASCSSIIQNSCVDTVGLSGCVLESTAVGGTLLLKSQQDRKAGIVSPLHVMRTPMIVNLLSAKKFLQYTSPTISNQFITPFCDIWCYFS